ncbi:MAG TPA: antibiotic biosynthesis monooxygenase [Bacteroidales bacterium]|jgi:autoinducer 2-degrading protein|nr:antibiotic biosynthesis monooxygenase [Bacteroidales bacterium]HOS71071.1 antibiotic biosynthesis monooxygenase [Bacteroidales bacterium]HQH25099.1 antibiotic biosynthesis monooxygenase [Bacteroidales bacterium]HQJ82701.1 antibiotic biosynthesis monooxygenase [Bacteroidales bacterium]
MIVTCVYVHVKPESIGDFIKATEENHNESVKEAGNFRFDFIQQADDPARFMVYEAYESEKDVEAHKQTAHYLKWRDKVAGMMAEPRKGVRYNILKPDKRE